MFGFIVHLLVANETNEKQEIVNAEYYTVGNAGELNFHLIKNNNQKIFTLAPGTWYNVVLTGDRI